MAQKLPKLTLVPGTKKGWDLEKNKTHEVVKHFITKEAATKGGVLKKVLGTQGGSVRIEKKKGGYQEERTYPRSKDPRKSKG
ncbi:MAG: DUF2188 domain-containing protein [Minisyncoccia bacterium]